MNPSKTEAIDPICGMTVDKATALLAERDREKFYFCSDHCRQKFLSDPRPPAPSRRASLETAADNMRISAAK